MALPESSGALASLMGHFSKGSGLPEHKPGLGLTEAQHRFMHWLNERGGTGIIDKSNNFIAGGDKLRSGGRIFWEYFLKHQLVDQEGARLTINDAGREYIKVHPVGKPFEGVRHGQVRPLPGSE